MPAETEDEICRKALELLSDLCSKGEVQDDNCLDFIYYFRDLGRPRYTDSGQPSLSLSLFSFRLCSGVDRRLLRLHTCWQAVKATF